MAKLILSGNRDLAAQYWGEGKRLLFVLDMLMDTAKIPVMAFSRQYIEIPGE